ncbi:MAG TPA: FKBP-type peptidyl-prolyl cis-trans isomerase [Jatrophihabitantaceae bacterium]
MVTSKQRREQSRRQLERQLEARQQYEASRKRRTLIATIAGTVILAVVVVIVVIVATGGKDKKKPAAASPPASTPTAPSSAPTSPTSSAPPAPAAKGPSVAFQGVTVKGAADLKGSPGVTSKSAKDATKLEFKDLVVGKGKAATPTSTVSVQYTGVLYKTGTEFDSSWSKGGQPVSFPLNQVVKGFTQGIGGTKGVPPMKLGGRRIMILPSTLGYGAQANGPIPANSSLVFVVDLVKVS